MIGLLVRVRYFAGHAALVAVLALVAALLVTGAPRIANRLSDQALRRDVAAARYLVRDIIYASPGETSVDSAAARLDHLRGQLPQPLPDLVRGQWFNAGVRPDDALTMAPAGFRARVGLRTTAAGVRFVAGRQPATRPDATQVEIAVSTAVADLLRLRPGTVLQLAGRLSTRVGVVVVGVFEAVDRSAPVWDDMAEALRPSPPVADDPATPAIAIALTDPVGITTAAYGLGPLTFTWRYRIDEHRLNTGNVEAVISALATTQRNPPHVETKVSTSLDDVLAQFAGQLRAVRALLAIVQAGLLATLLGLIALAAGLAVERRRAEFALVRARGGAVLAIGRGTLGESLVTLPAAVAAGWLLGRWAPGRPAGTEWLVLAVGAVAVLAVPVLAMTAQRHVTFVARRRELAARRPSIRRLTAELLVLLVAALGAYLLRRRGLSTEVEVDPYLATVPVLLAAGAAVLVLRLVPWPLRQAGRLAGRARGAVAFLGLARAGRSAPATAGPLAVLVVAVSVGVFCAAVTDTVDDARDRTAAQEVPADAELTGFRFGPQTAARLAAVPGVTAVEPVADLPSTQIRTSRGSVGYAHVRLVPVSPDRPAGRAVVSAALAAEIGSGAVAEVGSSVDFTVSAVVERYPGMDGGRFIVLPALSYVPTGFLITGRGFDPAALHRAGDDGQRAFLGHDSLVLPTVVATRAEYREQLERAGANQVLTFAFLVGTIGAIVLALLAIGFATLAGAGSRGPALVRLSTMGLSARQSRMLFAYELIPLVCAAVLAGILVGALLPRILGPALGLSSFTEVV